MTLRGRCQGVDEGCLESVPARLPTGGASGGGFAPLLLPPRARDAAAADAATLGFLAALPGDATAAAALTPYSSQGQAAMLHNMKPLFSTKFHLACACWQLPRVTASAPWAIPAQGSLR